MSSPPIGSCHWKPILVQSLNSPELAVNKFHWLQERLSSQLNIEFSSKISEEPLHDKMEISSETVLKPATAADATDSLVVYNGTIMSLSELDVRITTLQMSILNINKSMQNDQIGDGYEELDFIKQALGTIKNPFRDAILDKINKKLAEEQANFLTESLAKKLGEKFAKPEVTKEPKIKFLYRFKNVAIGKIKKKTPNLAQKLKSMDLKDL